MRENFPFPNLDNNHESIVNQHIYFTPPSSPLLITYLVNIRRVQLHPTSIPRSTRSRWWYAINKSLADDFPSLSFEKRRKSCSISTPSPPILPHRYVTTVVIMYYKNARVRWHFTRVYTYYTSLDHRDFLLSGPHDLHPGSSRAKNGRIIKRIHRERRYRRVFIIPLVSLFFLPFFLSPLSTYFFLSIVARIRSAERRNEMQIREKEGFPRGGKDTV